MVYVLAILIGVFKAVADTLAHHPDTSIFKGWNPMYWRHDHLQPEPPRVFNYPLDAWHISNSLWIASALCLPFYPYKYWWEYFIGGVLLVGTFNLFYNHILRRK